MNLPVLYSEELPPGAMWSAIIRRGNRVRLSTRGPDANVAALLYNAVQPLDRLNIPDTLKALHTAKLHTGHVLMSDMGRSLMSIVADSTGWHDPLGGLIDAEQVAQKFGQRSFQQYRNDFYRNGLDNFLIELGKHGLGERDIVACVNFFSKVVVDDQGRMSLALPGAPQGAFVELRADMDVLLALSNTPHPLSPPGPYRSCAVELTVVRGEPAAADDFCRNFRPECSRALTLSERWAA